MSTLRKILDKKQNGEIKVEEEAIYKSEVLGEDIVIKKKPLSEFFEVLADAEGENQIVGLNYMIHAFCPMFEDPDAVKAAMEFYQEEKGIKIGTPRELPELIFESNLGEMYEIAEVISDFYDLDSLGVDIKN